MNNNLEKSAIVDRIKTIDSQISALKEIRNSLIKKLQDIDPSEGLPFKNHVAAFPIESKIDLFKSYFRGREDVHARLWINHRTGKRGYSPACRREWVQGICEKPKIKCSDCLNQAFIPLDENVIKQHLEGKCVIGAYPIFKNDNCCFLAVDFDKEHWFEDANAFQKICVEEGIPAILERSKSGNGGHVWIFFSEEIPAVLARKLGSYLITKTMSNRYQLDMKSYDRLFPNQDTLPKGGFGNLIALPFQKEAMRSGNSIFIDDNQKPYEDQWSFLASTRKMSYVEVDGIVNKAVKEGQIIGLRMSPMSENDEPWTQLPSGKRKFAPVLSNLPESIDLVLANRIYIKSQALTSPLLNQLKRLAAFQNPEFYKKQRMRFSTYATPRVMCCAEMVEGYLSLPRGCLEDIEILAEEHGIKLNMWDERFTGQPLDVSFAGTLTDEQQAALKTVLERDCGVLVSSPGSGKTIIAIAAIVRRKTNVLILTHRKPLLDQWRLQLSTFLEKDIEEIGQIGGGKNKFNGLIDVAMVQSLDGKERMDDRIAEYGFIIVDECHHVSAFSFEKVLTQAKAKYVLGLTATPYRRDEHQPIIHMQCGPIVYQMKKINLPEHIEEGRAIQRVTEFQTKWNDDSLISELWRELISDEQRNVMIIEDVMKILSEGRFPLILTERKEHLLKLEEMLKDKVDFLFALYGGLKQKRRREIMEELKNCPDHSRKIILATGVYIGEGFDEPRLDTLFLTMPASFKGKIIQYVGRLHRFYKDKSDICIYDYVDKDVPVLSKMYRKRLKTYKMLGYKIEEKLA